MTSVEFSKRSPSYRSIHGFEPSPISLIELKKNFAALERARVYPFGLSDFDGVVGLKKMVRLREFQRQGQEWRWK
jgi:hypothetical protein